MRIIKSSAAILTWVSTFRQDDPTRFFNPVIVTTVLVNENVEALLCIIHRESAYYGATKSSVKITKIKSWLLEQGVPR